MFNWLKGKFRKETARQHRVIDIDIIREILNKVNDASFVVNADGDILIVNERFVKLSGLPSDGNSPRKLYAPEWRFATEAQFKATVEETRAHGGHLTFEHEVTMPDGSVRFFEVSVVIYHSDNEEHLWYMTKDVTELHRRQNELRDLNQLLNVIIDNLPVYLFAKDVKDDFRYIVWNKAFEEHSKIPASKVIGNTDFEVFPDYNDALMFREDDINVVNSGLDLSKKQETYMAADGSTRLVQTFKTVVQRDGRPLLIGLSLDMTNLQNVEQELVQERLKAEESDRLKSRFLANMSHEIRTPLNAIVGFASLLADAEDEETRHEFSNIIHQNTEILLQLINDILDLSKIEAGTLEYTRQPMDLLELCRAIYIVHKDKVHGGVKLIFDNDGMEGSFMLNEDRNRLTQVIGNLLSNAAKFTSKGEIHYGFTVKSEAVEFYVKDTGKGIPEDKQRAVFDRFVKLDAFTQGTGLGLPICKLIVETLGGSMRLKSEPGKGSVFSFTIPYKNDRRFSNHEPSLQQPCPVKDGVSRTILVAEDVSSNYLVVKALVKGRCNLLWAKDGIEAVEMARENAPDLILMDIKMPEKNGLDATSEIRAFNPDVPIVAVTANAFDSDRAISLHSGMNDFLPKPIDRASFERILAKYL